jgi:hypothetical protein
MMNARNCKLKPRASGRRRGTIMMKIDGIKENTDYGSWNWII